MATATASKKVTPEQVGAAMVSAGFPKELRVIASGIETVGRESGFGTTPGWDKEHDNGVLGYWQIQRSSHPEVSASCAMSLPCSTRAALRIWKAAGGCFACQPGPNPWEAGTDSGTQFAVVAGKVLGMDEKEIARELAGLGGGGLLGDTLSIPNPISSIEDAIARVAAVLEGIAAFFIGLGELLLTTDGWIQLGKIIGGAIMLFMGVSRLILVGTGVQVPRIGGAVKVGRGIVGAATR